MNIVWASFPRTWIVHKPIGRSTHINQVCKNSYFDRHACAILKLRTLVTRRVSEGKIGSASCLAYASGFHFCWKTDNAQLQSA
jgi:hypothetical protein